VIEALLEVVDFGGELGGSEACSGECEVSGVVG
jgi:hypothetical protein